MDFDIASLHAILTDSAVRQAHAIVRERLHRGDLAIDATCGNGHDTAFLAECVGPDGHVIAMDIQTTAIDATERRLKAAGLAGRVTLTRRSHEDLAELLVPGEERPLRAVMFNLGYLPGGDRTIVTRPESSAQAIATSAEHLAPGGIVSVVVYSGHDGGSEEARVVEDAARCMDTQRFDVRKVQVMNRPGNPPYVIAIFRR